MIRKLLLASSLLFLIACDTQSIPQGAAEVTATQAGEILVHNVKIYTMDAGFSTASAMLFDSEGKIHNVGDEQAMFNAFPDARRIDLGGKTIIPGLIDSHAHLAGLALSLSQAQLRDTASKEEVIQRLREHEQNLADGDWLLGRGWDQNDWPVKVFPSKRDLDAEFPDRPVWLRRIDGHAGWANSAALALADQDLAGDWQAEGGFIHRDEDGQANGVLIDGAMNLVESAVPEISPELFTASLDLALQANGQSRSDRRTRHGNQP